METNFPTKEKLHTDILELKYGPIQARVLRHDDVAEKKRLKEDAIREAELVDSEGITRTYALSFLKYDTNNSELVAIDVKIREGGLIGKTFREQGYEVKKNVIDVFLIDLPEWLKSDFQTDHQQAKARITEFYAKKENQTPVIYAYVLEIYSPDFKNPDDGINSTDKTQINPTTQSLEEVGISGDYIWKELDESENKDRWLKKETTIKEAEAISDEELKILHTKITKYLFQKEERRRSQLSY